MGPVDAEGDPVAETDMPIDIAHRDRRPVHDTGRVRPAQGEERSVEMLALPLIGLPANFRELQNYSPFYVTLPYERQSILSLARSPLAPDFAHSRLPAPP